MQTVARGLLGQVGTEFDVVAGVEARGFIFAGAVATMAGTGMVPIRKAGKLPKPAHRISYRKEYGTDTLFALEADFAAHLLDEGFSDVQA